MRNRASLTVAKAQGASTLRAIGNRMQVRGILGEVVTDLGCRVVAGEWRSGETLPIEAELIEQMAVSRSVVREAIRILNAKGLVRSRQMAGTTVLARSDWRHLDPDVIGWRMQAGDRRALLADLLKVRLVLEPAVARQATLQPTPEGRRRFERAWAAKVAVMRDDHSDDRARRDAFIAADLEFHRSLLSSIGSELLDQLFSVIEAALALEIDVQMQARGSTTRLVGMEESMAMHEAVHRCVIAGDAPGAEAAMRRLIERAIEDAEGGLALIEQG
jgi:GntR family transcriptional regulator, galactonate operon transcriptional repressor